MIDPKDFLDMHTAPRDGTRVQLLVRPAVETENTPYAVIEKAFFDDPLMGRERVWRGEQNQISPWLVIIGWKPYT